MGCRLSRLPGAERRQQMQAASSSGTASRLAACDRFRAAGVPFCVWLEDALAHLVVPTLTFDLYLLVPNVGAATRLLESAGYRRCRPGLAIECIPQFHNMLSLPPRQRAAAALSSSADSGRPSVILLPGRASKDVAGWFPTLPALYTSLVAKWLSLDEAQHDLRLRLAVFLGYVYEYLDGTVRLPAFEQQIPTAYRSFHRDQLCRRNTADLGTHPCQLYYQRTVACAQAPGDSTESSSETQAARRAGDLVADDGNSS